MKPILIISLLSTLILFACSPYKDSQLYGKWYIVDVQNTQMNKSVHFVLDSCFYFNFYEDHNLYMRSLFSLTGTWELKGADLEMTSEIDETDIVEIKKLTNDSLIFKNKEKHLMFFCTRQKPENCL